jgi:superfamily I DNA/RNA helicase
VRKVEAADLLSAVADVVADELEVVDGGTVAVIAPEALLGGLGSRFGEAGLPWGDPAHSGLSAPVTLLGVTSAKGLEFDGVIVVEPAALVAEAARGLRALFVAVTRTTRRLAIVHSEPLPASLVSGLDVARRTLSEAPADDPTTPTAAPTPTSEAPTDTSEATAAS